MRQPGQAMLISARSARRTVCLRRIAPVVAACLTLAPLFAAETNRPARDAARLVWPPPPAEPRIAYVRSIEGPADFGRKLSAWAKLFNRVTGRDAAAENLVKPLGVAFGENGTPYVADSGTATVNFFESRGMAYHRLNRAGRQQPLALPVAVAGTRETLFVADAVLRRVLAYDLRGNYRFEVEAPFSRPTALAIVDDRLYVADAPEHRIGVFDLAGRHLFTFGNRGEGPGEFNYPTHLAAAPGSRLLVTDSGNGRVQVLDRDGHFLAALGSAGDRPGHFGRPKGVAADSFGHVYVVDALFDTVQVFDMEGRLLMRWGTSGQRPGEFWLPAGIAISSSNDILVADSYNRRVQVFKYIGKP